MRRQSFAKKYVVLPTSIKMIGVRQQKESIGTPGLKIIEKSDKRSPPARNSVLSTAEDGAGGCDGLDGK